MIQIENVTKTFPTVTALDQVSLTIREGEFFGLLGPNGAGKSTLMNLLIGYKKPDAGSITIDGVAIHPEALAVRHRLGLVPQSLALYEELSAEQNLKIFGGFYQIPHAQLKDRIRLHLDAVQLDKRRHDKVKTFSGGMKRRLNIAASLLHDPPILLCDEPTVGVDPQSRNAIFDYLLELNTRGKTIVYTTHYMEEAERLCSRIGIIDHGKIIALGSVGELLEQLKSRETITIVKNPATVGKQATFERFGELHETDDFFELQPKPSLKLSDFFAAMETTNIPYPLIQLRKPTLETLFLHLTGRRLRD